MTPLEANDMHNDREVVRDSFSYSWESEYPADEDHAAQLFAAQLDAEQPGRYTQHVERKDGGWVKWLLVAVPVAALVAGLLYLPNRAIEILAAALIGYGVGIVTMCLCAEWAHQSREEERAERARLDVQG